MSNAINNEVQACLATRPSNKDKTSVDLATANGYVLDPILDKSDVTADSLGLLLDTIDSCDEQSTAADTGSGTVDSLDSGDTACSLQEPEVVISEPVGTSTPSSNTPEDSPSKDYVAWKGCRAKTKAKAKKEGREKVQLD